MQPYLVRGRTNYHLFVICAVLGVCASCSNSYTSQSSPEQGSQADVNPDHGGMASQMTSFASQIQHAMTHSQLLSAEQPEASAGQQRPAAMFAPAAPTTTQYLCSCITINPAAPVHHAPASADSFHSAEASAGQSCSSASHHSSEDCPHQHAAHSSPAQEQYAANNGGY
ncbi:hypothetical protein GHT06_016477 [Daphnia sinensis]|uniref:Uncharacterized protein n=1 Tax=Daphnia sinensis TaxID=1820382 RepID=A0AAD5KQB8_9CRUS|nr:hypothetical protein GHT06_016477 [Daphnia sinensis]